MIYSGEALSAVVVPPTGAPYLAAAAGFLAGLTQLLAKVSYYLFFLSPTKLL